jgi:hypothetical protein
MRVPEGTATREFENWAKLPYNMALGAEMQNFYADPLGHVMFSYPWSTDPAIQIVDWRKDKRFEPYQDRFLSNHGPDLWACQFLDELGDEIFERGFDGINAVEPVQFATVSGHGIGKSVICAWLTKFIMDTRPYARITVTATTADQLRARTWAEVGKWHRMSLTRDWFDFNAGRGSMAMRHKFFPEEWFTQAVTCKEENSEAFAGQHAVNSTSAYIFDEASGVPNKIFEVREGGLTDGEPMVFDFGNGTRKSGTFFEECAGNLRDQFIVRSIDSREVQITNKKRLQAWIEHYGEDSDFCRVRVRGMFPSASSLQFIGSDIVEDAMRRPVVENRHAPLILGVDVARHGENNSVIYPRVGNDARTYRYRKYNGLDGPQLASKIVECINEFTELGLPPAAIFIDETGVGYSVLDHLHYLGYHATGINFGTRPSNPKAYRYRGDEMWGRMRDAIRQNLVLANTNEIRRDLTQREYGYTIDGNKLHLERKADMEKRGLVSPDIADALALTFADQVPDAALPMGQPRTRKNTTVNEMED